MTMRLRSLLFVPGDRPERFGKALATAADGVCIDLEDAVATHAKPDARRHALACLAQDADEPRLWLRLNPTRTQAGDEDVQALLAARLSRVQLVLTKVAQPRDVAAVLGALAGVGTGAAILALIESAQGLLEAAAIAATPGVQGLVLGTVDLAAQFAARFDSAALTAIRLTVKTAATAAGVMAIDGPTLDLADGDELAASAASAAALGFDGKLAIHPAQIAAINAAFTPDAAAIAHAQRIVTAAQECGSGAFALDGRMIDQPVIDAAHRLLRRAER